MSSNLFVYGANAFYDRRTSVDSDQHNVRMVLVTKSRHLLAFNKVNVTCTLSSENKMVLQTLASMWIGWQRPLKVDGVFYKSLTMSCPVNASASIDAVELTLQSSNFTRTRSLPVMYPDYPRPLQHSKDPLDITNNSGATSYIVNESRDVKYEHEFGMCLGGGTMYGEVSDADARWLVEWFEVNRMFGVTEFNLYNATAQFSDKAKAVIEFYQEIGVLKFHQLPPPLTHYDVNDRNAVDLSMRVSLNECMYMNMYRYKYIVVIDLDEIIVPYRSSSYHEVFAGSNDVTRTFPSFAFFLTYPAKTNRHDLRTLSYVYRNNDMRAKSVLNPRHCLYAYSHGCVKAFPGSKRYIMSSRAGHVHHYRRTCTSTENKKKFNSDHCDVIAKRKAVNLRMLDFEQEVVTRTRRANEQIFGADSL